MAGRQWLRIGGLTLLFAVSGLADTVIGFTACCAGGALTYTPLIFPGNVAVGAPTGINASGEIIGAFDSTSVSRPNGFVDFNGTFTALNYPGADYTIPHGLNDVGQIAGVYGLNGVTHGFLYSGGVFTTVDAPGSVSGTILTGINNSGEITGDYGDNLGNTIGFTYVGGTFSPLNYPGTTSTEPGSINDGGQVVGTYTPSNNVPFLFSGGTFSTLTLPCGVPTGINNAGQITIGCALAGGYIDSGGTFTSLAFSYGAYSAPNPTGISNNSEIVGFFNDRPAPAPEPGASVLVIIGMTGITLIGRILHLRFSRLEGS